MQPPASKSSPPDCFRCTAFYVTYEERHPYGCRTFGFKSVVLPRQEVRRSSGRDCHAFTPRPPRPGEAQQESRKT
jgi:hypothetical protein